MDVAQFEVTQKEAAEQWKLYRDACKLNPKDAFSQDMKACYNQLKQGRKIIDMDETMKRGGLNMKGEPRLAVCRADALYCILYIKEDGTYRFTAGQDRRKVYVDDFTTSIFPKLTSQQIKEKGGDYWGLILRTVVPAIPPICKPKANLENYHVLWEVDEWKIIPPKDPYLLKRIHGNIFVVLAGWNLSELERAVMKGRLSSPRF